MKLKLALLTTIAAAAISMVSSSQAIAAPHTPVTDSERGAAGLRARFHIAPDSRRSIPIAYGYVYPNGSLPSSSGNVTASYNAADGWYVITIHGFDYYYSSYSTTVTPSLPHNAICDTDSIGGTLLVRCFDLSGNPIQAEFGFITF